MSNREKVVKGLECCMSEQICKGCPYKETDECEGRGYYYSKAIEYAIALLKEQPEIVRCKDCVFRDARDGMCEHVQQIRDPDWYCADGVRRDDDG